MAKRRRWSLPWLSTRPHAKLLGHCSEDSTRITAVCILASVVSVFNLVQHVEWASPSKRLSVPKSVESDNPSIDERLHCRRHLHYPEVGKLQTSHTSDPTGSCWSMQPQVWSSRCSGKPRTSLLRLLVNKCTVLGLQVVLHWNVSGVIMLVSNKLWEARCKSAKSKLHITFQYTAARTPQQNSIVESRFLRWSPIAAEHSWRRLIVPAIIRCIIWNEAVATATLLDALMVVDDVNGEMVQRVVARFH